MCALNEDPSGAKEEYENLRYAVEKSSLKEEAIYDSCLDLKALIHAEEI